MMDKLRQLLQAGRNGNAVLFCGAGLTADCLNFEDDSSLGVTSHLLQLLNGELKANGKQSGFKDIRNAAKRFKIDLGAYRLMFFLKERFRLSKVSSSIAEIVAYPWVSIYTTNFDNGLELAAQSLGKRYSPLNNLDDPNTIVSGMPIIHLHGFAEVWNEQTFEKSCVLDAHSYFNLSGVTNWLDRLRFEIERAEVVVFLGFSAADFHLNKVFFDTSGLVEKAVFINRTTSDPDQDERATQEEFGQPIYIGREEFALLVTESLQIQMPLEPRLASFGRYKLPQPSASIPSVQDIEELFIWGKILREHLKRDYDLAKSDYHVIRNEVNAVQKCLELEGAVVLLQGDICDGKTMIISGAMIRLSVARPVFELRHAYIDLLDEASSILSSYPSAVFIVENCFSLHQDRLLGLARLVSATKGALILSARNISTEGESAKVKGLQAIQSFRLVKMGPLQQDEIDAFVVLIDQVAGWQGFFGASVADRCRFIQRDCKGIFPNVLLRLLNSEYVRNKYREEYNKTMYLSPRDRQMIVASLLIANIGLDAPVSFISDIFEQDFPSVLKSIAMQSGRLQLVQADEKVVRTIPSIGARNLLKNVIGDCDIVNTNIYILEKMAEENLQSDFLRHTFYQLMRYSILNSVVSDASEINRFFDHISKIAFFREMPLFWLQWHMAMCAQEIWSKAEDYLTMGYTAAKSYEKRRRVIYNKKQLDDRKAKFLVARAVSTGRGGAELFRDMREALVIVERLMHDSELTYHPFETLLDTGKLLGNISGKILEGQSAVLAMQFKKVVELAKRRLTSVPDGYYRSNSVECLSQIEAIKILQV